jgi:hypothetical protein
MRAVGPNLIPILLQTLVGPTESITPIQSPGVGLVEVEAFERGRRSARALATWRIMHQIVKEVAISVEREYPSVNFPRFLWHWRSALVSLFNLASVVVDPATHLLYEAARYNAFNRAAHDFLDSLLPRRFSLPPVVLQAFRVSPLRRNYAAGLQDWFR